MILAIVVVDVVGQHSCPVNPFQSFALVAVDVTPVVVAVVMVSIDYLYQLFDQNCLFLLNKMNLVLVIVNNNSIFAFDVCDNGALFAQIVMIVGNLCYAIVAADKNYVVDQLMLVDYPDTNLAVVQHFVVLEQFVDGVFVLHSYDRLNDVYFIILF